MKSQMADRTSAELFGEIFKLLAELDPHDKQERAKKFWEQSRSYDFHPYQMDADYSLLRLGLARRNGVDVVYFDDEDFNHDNECVGRGVAGDYCEVGNNCGRMECPECQQ